MDRESHELKGLEGLEGLDSGLSVQQWRTLADDPNLLERLDGLDHGLIEVGDHTDTGPSPPPLTARLMFPDAWQPRPLSTDAPKALESDRLAGYINAWTATATLILAIFLGAMAAAFVFHERLSQIVVR